MKKLTAHAKTKWTIRGDHTRNLSDAWENGLRVGIPNKAYGEARLDPDSDSILIAHGDKIRTVLNLYRHSECVFVKPVWCESCGEKHMSPIKCPSCGSSRWTRD